jgi:predicted MFS family arabinose efflux permease
VGGLVVDLFGVPALPPIAALLSLGSLGLLALALRQEPARPSGA